MLFNNMRVIAVLKRVLLTCVPVYYRVCCESNSVLFNTLACVKHLLHSYYHAVLLCVACRKFSQNYIYVMKQILTHFGSFNV